MSCSAWPVALLRLVGSGVLVASASAAPAPVCPPPGWTPPDLQALKAAQWGVPDGDRRQALALALTACLADPDPELRDGVAFDALSSWLRAKQLSAATQLALTAQLLVVLQQPPAPNDPGVAQPFAALALSELARADRVQAFLSPAQRDQLVQAAVVYLRGISDFRGYVPDQGWRHGVAHGADLLMQLALNPALDPAAVPAMLQAIAAQVPNPAHVYAHGEPQRLVRPVVFLARQAAWATADWTAWFAQLTAPPLWQNPPTPELLTRRHNLSLFLLALHRAVLSSDDAGLRERVLPGLTASLRQLD